MSVNEIIKELEALSSPDHFTKLAHFGIKDTNAIGVKIPDLRNTAMKICV